MPPLVLRCSNCHQPRGTMRGWRAVIPRPKSTPVCVLLGRSRVRQRGVLAPTNARPTRHGPAVPASVRDLVRGERQRLARGPHPVSDLRLRRVRRRTRSGSGCGRVPLPSRRAGRGRADFLPGVYARAGRRRRSATPSARARTVANALRLPANRVACLGRCVGKPRKSARELHSSCPRLAKVPTRMRRHGAISKQQAANPFPQLNQAFV